MKEYIERESVMQAFSDFVWNSNHSDLVPAPTWNHAVEIVRDIPAADVVKVVRCRDCRYFYNGFMKCCTNHFGVVLTDENGFCHHAKRREDEGGNTRWVESNTYITPQQKKM